METNILKDRRIFVAGGTGLAGSAVVRRLVEIEPAAQIVVPHRSQSGVFIQNDRIEYRQGDLCMMDECLRLSAGSDMAVMAAATTGGAKASRDMPWAQVTDNVVMDARMLQAFHDNGIKRVVYISTASAYQPFNGFIRENEMNWSEDPHDAHLGVGWAKRYGEKACWFWHKKTCMEIMILRLANVFGPYSRFDPDVSNVIAALVRKAVGGMDPFEVWGSPDIVRDVIYADDFAAAVIKCLQNTTIPFGTYNIGSGVETTIGDIVTWVIEASGNTPSRVEFGAKDNGSINFRALDISKARAELGWAPEISVKDGIFRTVEWWKRNIHSWTR